MLKNVSGQKVALFAFVPSTGLAKIGDAANLTAYVSKDHGSVTVLGDTSATEMDATNAPGWYLFDLTQGETNADALLFSAKSSTGDVSVVGRPIDTAPNRFSSLVIDAAGLVDATAVKVGPTGAATAQTAGDIPARLPAALVSGRMDASVGAMAADVLTAAAAAADFTTEIQTGLATAAALSTVASYVDTEVAAIKAKTDLIPASPAAVGDIPTALQNADALLNRDMAAVSDTNSRSPLNALRFVRNGFSIAGTTLTVLKEDDTTPAYTRDLTTDASADPITGVS